MEPLPNRVTVQRFLLLETWNRKQSSDALHLRCEAQVTVYLSHCPLWACERPSSSSTLLLWWDPSSQHWVFIPALFLPWGKIRGNWVRECGSCSPGLCLPHSLWDEQRKLFIGNTVWLFQLSLHCLPVCHFSPSRFLSWRCKLLLSRGGKKKKSFLLEMLISRLSSFQSPALLEGSVKICLEAARAHLSHLQGTQFSEAWFAEYLSV